MAQTYFGRPFGYKACALPCRWLQNLAFALDSVLEFLRCDLLWGGYREVPGTELSRTLNVSQRKAKKVARANGLKVLGTGPSYYHLPDKYPRMGTQGFICLVKPGSPVGN